MAGGFGIDLVLFGACLAAVVWLYRQIPGDGAEGAAAFPRAPSVPVWQALRGYYPRIARQAGFDPDSLRPLYWLAKGGFGLLLPLVLLETASRWGRSPSPLVLLVPLLLGFLLPDLWLLRRRRRRQRQIARSLGYFVDLLVAFLYSGLSLERAFVRVGREGFDPSHPLGWELALVGRELDAGQDPSLVFQALAERTGVGDLRGIASALRIGLRVGAPVRATLQTQAELLWTKRREMALRQINAAAAKVMLPVMLCGFPIFLLLTFFPAILQILNLLRQLRGE